MSINRLQIQVYHCKIFTLC